MTSPEQHLADLLATFGSPTACTAQLLCDRHPAGAVAFTPVEPDLTGGNVRFGELEEPFARMATALAELGVGGWVSGSPREADFICSTATGSGTGADGHLVGPIDAALITAGAQPEAPES